MDYTTLSLYEVRTGIDAVGLDGETAFGRLDAAQLNWQPARNTWSVGQGLEHLLKANTHMFAAAEAALDEAPEPSDVTGDVVERFVRQQRDLAAKLRAVDETRAERIVMASPFVTVITYSVLDGCRLMLAHDHRHVEQARRVMQMDEFPR